MPSWLHGISKFRAVVDDVGEGNLNNLLHNAAFQINEMTKNVCFLLCFTIAAEIIF